MPYFVLKSGAAREVPDLLTWARWFDTHSPDRIVEKTTIGDVEISTFFFGLETSAQNDPPRLYHTTINPPDEIKAVYSTLEEARAGHVEICEQATAAQ